MNNKGNIYAIITIFVILFLLVFGGLIMVIGSSVMNWVFDIAVPEFTNLGVVGDTNLSAAAQYTLTPVNTFVQSWTFLSGVAYILGIVCLIALAFAYRATGEKWMMGLYIALVIMFVMTCILLSNIYEEYYTGTDDLALRLQEHMILSFMILYSPLIMGIVSLISGVILFSAPSQEVYS